MDNKKTLFWEKGFEILQNIQDRMTMDKSMKRATDRITFNTVDEAPEETRKRKCNVEDTTEYDDITNFCEDNG